MASIREQIISEAVNYVVVNDGQFRFPVRKSDLRAGDSEETIRAMDGDSYAEFCNSGVPADLRVGDVGTKECIDLCNALVEAGAELWNVQ